MRPAPLRGTLGGSQVLPAFPALNQMPADTPQDKPAFLSRWSRRKADARQATPPAERVLPAGAAVAPVTLTATPGPAADSVAQTAASLPSSPARHAPSNAATDEPAVARQPPPTLEDVALLTRDADYTRFVAPSVDPNVRNAALKKLFTDPHFNVMDGLDTYIDDYGKPDPLPPGMLRLMAQAQSLGLFDTDDQADAAGHTAAKNDEDADLQLQPDDSAGRPGLEPGAGEDPASQH